MTTSASFDPPLDPGIERHVLALREVGIDTFESCEGGGDGHAYLEPTIRFHGCRAEGYKALAAALAGGLPVSELRRVWPVIDGEATGPYWELTFSPREALHTPVVQSIAATTHPKK